MTFYQELQLNQAGSKNLIRHAESRREKLRHTLIYLLKIVITLAFCMAFVIAFSTVFGGENSIVGVVVLLCVMVFRNADLGIRTSHGAVSLILIFGILAFGPKLANASGLFGEFLVHVLCIFGLTFLGCHNVVMSNQSTLVLGYLLLYGYDVTGRAYLMRLAGIGAGAVLTVLVYCRNHRNQVYKRGFRSLLQEFDPASTRTRWQLTVTLGVASVLLLAGALRLPRAMWTGIAAMSVMVPFDTDLKKRVKGRIPGNIAGGLLFLIIYSFFPETVYSCIGIIGGIGVGLSVSYGWQAVFNSLGAMSIAVGILGLPGAVFFRMLNNALGAVYGLVFEKLFHRSVARLSAG